MAAKLFVGNLSFQATEEDLRELFQQAHSHRTGGDERILYVTQWCDHPLRHGLPPHWEPVLDTHK